MSLLDDVSIVVTPNGYKAGELYAVIPTFALGSELVNNSIFNSDNTSDWGNAFYDSFTFDSSEGGFYNLQRVAADARTNINLSSVLTVGKRYKVTVVARGSGSIKTGLTASSYSTQPSAVFTLTSSFASYSTVVTVTSGLVYGVLWNDDTNSNIDYQSYSVKEYTSADMDVTRATAATRVDENGLVNYAEVIGGELLSQPVNLESDFTAVNGGSFTNASTLVTTGGSVEGFTKTSFLIVGKTYKLIIAGTTTSSAFSFGNTTSGGNEYGSGFGTFYFTASGNTAFWFRQSTAGTTNITSFSVKEVIRDNVPRIDYTGGGCPHILAEPMRTNLIPYSEEISQYNQSSSTASDNETISPDGTNNASKISKDGVNANDRVTTIITISNSTDYSLSAFIKNDDVANGGVSTIGARITGGTVFRQGYEWNGSTLSVTNSSQSGTRTNVLLEDYGNGWWKVGFSFTSDGTEARLEFDIDRVNGTDTTAIFLWGAQLEAGSYGTSYIPNFGTVAGVTRNQDIFTRDGIGSLINSTEGVLFVEMAALSDDGTFRILSLSSGSAANRILMYYSSDSNAIAYEITYNNSQTAYFSHTLSDSTILNKVAVKWKVNDFAFWVNGTEVHTVSSGNPASGLNLLNFSSSTGSNNFYGKVKQLQVYDTSLSDTQLAALTS